MAAPDQNPYDALRHADDNDSDIDEGEYALHSHSDDVNDIDESDEDDVYSYDAEAEWEESKAQLNAMFSLVVFPYVGRWLGKQFSFWLWSRWIAAPPPSWSSAFSLQWINAAKRIAD